MIRELISFSHTGVRLVAINDVMNLGRDKMSMFQTIGLIAIGAGAVYGYSLFNGGSKPNTAYATADNAALTYMSNLTRDIEQFKKSYCPSKINQSLDSCVISAIEGYVGQR